MQTALILIFALASATACAGIGYSFAELVQHRAAIRRALRLIARGSY